GLKAAGLADEASLAAFFENSLWGLQVEEEAATGNAAASAATAFQLAAKEVGEERLNLASLLGLSLSSFETLYTDLIGHIEEFVPGAGIERQRRQVEVLLGASLQLPEIRRGSLQAPADSVAHVDPVMSWLAGADYGQILSSGVTSRIFQKN